jgi:hypothetical protein
MQQIMKKILLPLLLCAAITPPLHAQIATSASAPGVPNYGKLFSDGSGLYEISNDTLNSINTGTGARSFISKLPAAPGGSGTVRWAKPFAIKTPNGSIIAQDVFNGGRTTYVWAGTGTGSWDTIAVVPGTASPGEPFRLGSKYAMAVSNNGGQLLRTDGTRAGTTVAMQLPSAIQSYKRGSNRLFFWTTPGAGAPSTYTQRIYTIDDNTVQVIDSSSNVTLPLAAIGDDLYYEYKHQVNTGGTSVSTTHSLKKWTAASNTSATLASGLNPLSYFVTGTVFKGSIIASKVDSGHNGQDLVAIDPATGNQSYLTNNPAASVYPIYYLDNSGAGTDHLYILADSGGKSGTWVSDGATAAGTKKIYQAGTGTSFFIYQPQRFGPFQAAICGDNVVGGQYRSSGTFDMQVFSLGASGALAEQDLNTGVIGGSDPNYFVPVGSEVFFTTQQTSATNSPHDLYKITACATTTQVPHTIGITSTGIFPNPADSRIYIRVSGPARLELYDATGRIVMSTQVSDGNSYPVSQLPAGLYQYRLLAAGGTYPASGRLSVIH